MVKCRGLLICITVIDTTPHFLLKIPQKCQHFIHPFLSFIVFSQGPQGIPGLPVRILEKPLLFLASSNVRMVHLWICIPFLYTGKGWISRNCRPERQRGSAGTGWFSRNGWLPWETGEWNKIENKKIAWWSNLDRRTTQCIAEVARTGHGSLDLVPGRHQGCSLLLAALEEGQPRMG